VKPDAGGGEAARSARIASEKPGPDPANSARYFAILSDIHGNIDALEAVQEDMESYSVRGIFCLGDIVGYGPEPGECVSRIMESCAATVLGNHEVMLFLLEKFGDDLAETIRDPLNLARETLSADQMRWLRGLPITADLSPITLCHSSLNEPAAFNYIDSIEEAGENFAAQATEISFHGHTHIPAIWKEVGGKFRRYHPSEKPVRLQSRNRYAINVGSVGQPRDGDPRASYALYDYEERILLHRRVEYDIKKAQSRFEKAGLPDQMSQRLTVGR